VFLPPVGLHRSGSGKRSVRLDPSEGSSLRRQIREEVNGVATVLWIIAAILVIAGIVSLLRGSVVAGIVLIVVGLLVGPGGVSIFA
jgi:hypothetical protein